MESCVCVYVSNYVLNSLEFLWSGEDSRNRVEEEKRVRAPSSGQSVCVIIGL